MPYSRIQYLCWLFSGAEISLLKECPTDYNRQASIGFTILMTCLFAGMAGGFAAWRFSDGSIVAAIIFGFVWAMLIFSIDRSMVVTLKKDPTQEESKAGKFIAFGARMVLAGLLAFLISIPLETYIFNTQIENEISHENTDSGTELRKELEQQYGLPKLEQEKARLIKDKDDAERNGSLPEPPTGEYKAAAEQVRSLRAAYQQVQQREQVLLAKAAAYKQKTPTITVYENGESITRPNYNSPSWGNYLSYFRQAKALAASRHNAENKLRAAESDKGAIKAQFYRDNSTSVKDLKIRLDKQLKDAEAAIVVITKKIDEELPKRTKGGFIREFTALEQASHKVGGLFVMLWLIRAMFFVIELLPTIVKLVTPLGEYDRQIHAHEQLFALALSTNYQIMQGRELLRQQTEQQIAEQLEQMRLERETELGKNVLDRTATFQNDLAERMLKEWHRQEREKQKAATAPKPVVSPPVPVVLPPVPLVNVSASVQPAAPAAQADAIASPVIISNQPAIPDAGSAYSSLSTTSPITLAALTAKDFWWLPPGMRQNWYKFENGATNNRVRRKINDQTLELGHWEHPNGDKSLLRIIFEDDATEYKIIRLTNMDMVLRNAATDQELTFTA